MFLLSLKVGVKMSFSTVNASVVRIRSFGFSKPLNSFSFASLKRSSRITFFKASSNCGGFYPFSVPYFLSLSGSTTMIPTMLSLRESPYIHDCATHSDWTYIFSSFSGAIYSPYDNLKIFFALSIIFTDPFGSTIPTSPLCIQPG